MGEARMEGRLYALKYYPCFRLPLLFQTELLQRRGLGPDRASWVTGEVYRLDQPLPTLQMLDSYEDFDYRRVLRPAVLANGTTVPCWVYCYRKPLPELRRVVNGHWSGRPHAPIRYRAYS